MSNPRLLEQFDRIETRRRYEHILDQILRLVESGDLGPGDKLPPERVLSEQLGVSRNVLREAFCVLEDRGLIYSRHGGGRYLRVSRSAAESTNQHIIRLQQAAILDVWDVREALELQAARLAARRVTGDDIRAMEILVQQLEELNKFSSDEITLDHRVELDHKFHLVVAEASGNPVLVRELERYLGAIRSMQTGVLSALDRTRERGQHHRRIVQAIAEHDEEKAVELLHDHLQTARRKYEDDGRDVRVGLYMPKD